MIKDLLTGLAFIAVLPSIALVLHLIDQQWPGVMWWIIGPAFIGSMALWIGAEWNDR